MINAQLMSQAERKKLQDKIKEIYGTIIEGTLYKGSNERIYLGTEETRKVQLEKINAEGVGLYIGRNEPDGFRASIEGSQLLTNATNKHEITKEQALEWLKGEKIDTKTEKQGYHLITCEGDILGTGKISNNNIWNYTPKERRIKNPKNTNLKTQIK